MTQSISIKNVFKNNKTIEIVWNDGKKSNFHFMWLRDNCPSDIHPTARERLTRFLVLRKLAETESLEVSEEDIQNEVDSLIESAGENADQMRRNLSSDAVRSNIGSSLLNQKIMSRIVEISQGIAAGANDDESIEQTPDQSDQSNDEIATESITENEEEK